MLCTWIGVSGENCASVGVGLVAAFTGLALGAVITWRVAKYYAIQTRNDIESSMTAATAQLTTEVERKLRETGDALRNDMSTRLQATAEALAKTIPDDAAAKVTRNTLVNTAVNAAPFFAHIAGELLKNRGNGPGVTDSGPAAPRQP